MSVDILTMHMQEKKRLIMPISYSKMSVTYPVSRKKKHAGVFACISRCGIATKPLFTVQRVTVDSELY